MRKKTISLKDQVIFVGPAFIFFIVIMMIPFIMGIYYSFTWWEGGLSAPTWVGVKNFHDLFSDKNFIRSIGFTVKITLIIPLLTNALALFLAAMLVLPLKAKNLMRVSFLLPYMISGLLLGFVWQFIFIEIFPSLGNLTGLAFFNLSWLANPETGMWGIVIVSVWSYVGYLMIIYVAALVGVPKEILEAAYIDGASAWQTFRLVTFPMIMPAVTICLFLSIAHTCKSFDVIWSLTGGGPFNSTQSIAVNIVNEIDSSRWGVGTAKALVFFVFISVITLTQVWITRRKEIDV